jgi:hypothetical protein
MNSPEQESTELYHALKMVREYKWRSFRPRELRWEESTKREHEHACCVTECLRVLLESELGLTLPPQMYAWGEPL